MGKPIDVRIVLAAVLVAAGSAGCFQQLDTGATGGPESSIVIQPDGADASTLPDAFSAGDLQTALGSQPCTPGSALCYELCNSPSCALQNNDLPTNLDTTPALLPDGGDAKTPCEQIIAKSMQIRQQSCAPCHGSMPGQSGFYWILSDSDIVSKVPNGVTAPVVLPGDPDDSLLMVRVTARLAGTGATGMPPTQTQLTSYLSPAVANTIVYPTPEDVSVLYTWIKACVPNADAGVFDNSYYGGNYGPSSVDGGDK